MKRALLIYPVLVWMILCISGTGTTAEIQKESFSFTDALGREITVKLPLERIVVVNTSVAIILRAIGVDIEKKVVGVTHYVRQNPQFWPRLKDKPGIRFTSPSYEILAELNPEAVFFYKSSPLYTNGETLKTLGIKSIYLDAFDPRTLDKDILLLGKLFGKEKQAQKLVEWCRSWEQKVTDRIAGIPPEDRARVFYYIYPESNLDKGIYRTCSRNESSHGLLEKAGAVNVAAGLPLDRTNAGAEWIMEQNPDVILAGVVGKNYTGYSADPATSRKNLDAMRQRLMKDKAFSRTRAGKTGKVFVHAQDLKQGPAYVMGIVHIAKYLYPDRFKDIDPDLVAAQYYQKWCGLPYQGIFVSPEPDQKTSAETWPPANGNTADEALLMVRDSAGRDVEIPMPVRRIAGLHTSACREFCLLGIEDRVVGVTNYLGQLKGRYPSLSGKPIIGSVYTPGYETILENRPDVLIMSTTPVNLDPVVKKLTPHGIRVVALDLQPSRGSTVYEREAFYDAELETLGRITGRSERAKAYIQWKQGIIDLIRERTKGVEKRRVLGINHPGGQVLEKDYAVWAGTRIIELSGGINTAAGLTGETVSPEWILEQAPDTVIIASYHENEGMGYQVKDTALARQTLERIKSDRVFSRTRAAGENRIYLFSYYGTASGGQTPLGALYLAKRLYPGRFSDIEPEKVLQEYFEKWFNIQYQGLWFYP